MGIIDNVRKKVLSTRKDHLISQKNYERAVRLIYKKTSKELANIWATFGNTNNPKVAMNKFIKKFEQLTLRVTKQLEKARSRSLTIGESATLQSIKLYEKHLKKPFKIKVSTTQKQNIKRKADRILNKVWN